MPLPTGPQIAIANIDTIASRLLAAYGSEATLVAYTKAVYFEAASANAEAKRWRAVLGRVVEMEGRQRVLH